MKQAIEDYIKQAEQYQQAQQRRNYDISPRELYDEIIGAYSTPFGVAWNCLRCVRKEYKDAKVTADGNPKLDSDDEIKQRANFYLGRLKDVRHAIWDMIDNATLGMNEEKNHRMYRRLFLDEMRKLKRFARIINFECDRVRIPIPKESPGESQHCVEWEVDEYREVVAAWNAEHPDHLMDADKIIKGCEIIISKEERVWLRGGMLYDTDGGLTPMQRCWNIYLRILSRIICFWAAKLLKYGIDIHELEKEEFGCNIITNLNRHSVPYFYYCDRMDDDHRGDCCVFDKDEAEELLEEIRNKPSLEKRGEEETGKTTDIQQQSNYNCQVLNSCQVTINNTTTSLQLQGQEYKTGSQNAKGSEKGRISGNKGKSGKESKPIGHPKTLVYYTTNIEDDEKKARKERVEAVFKLWTKWEWIDKNTIADDFHSFFKGHDRYCNIKWIANAAILTHLLQALILRDDVIAKQTGCHSNSLVVQQFGFKKSDYREIDNVACKRIDFTIFVLDVKHSFQEIYKEAENNMPEGDKILLKTYADDELKKAMEEEVKAGNARIRKNTYG